MTKIPIIREDDGVFMGYVAKDRTGWMAQTIWGYTYARSETQAVAEQAVRDQGLLVLKGVWQYYDEDDQDWHACIIKKPFENRVDVVRTTDMGYQDPDDYKLVTIKNPTETNLVKVS